MLISVIIPTYNRLDVLLQALKSLQEQTLENFELLVIDNAAAHKIESAVTKFNQTAKVRVKYIPEPQLGLHNARHTGAKNAQGDVLVFTDDDATFDPGWLQAYAQAFTAHPQMVAAGGPVRPVWEASPPQWLLDYMGDSKMFTILSLMEPYAEFRLDAQGFFFGVNMAIRCDVLFKVGGFNPESFGDIWLGDGESGLNRKLWDNNLLIGYIPDAIAYHHVPPSRMTVDYFCRRMANEGACDMYSHYHNNGIPNQLRLLMHLVQITLKNKFWLKSLVIGKRNDPTALNIKLHATRTQSQIKYILRLIFDKDFQKLVLEQDWLLK
ncbi:glycosyltransferase family 2 protein [Iningainema tapete]|uniref:Glycosyltransferase family 2 protein n=1 Tax=Iningainema tapete BLCC-T55 TaxID=2748662 RepID=A0A8J6XPU1_9CYAN|nr:glycosyltransferase family 2 protein [Iningainema tapete]MBD2775939.1 glycosyltransferase family 2 protein [Iningainema tapete BLCC-T55]